MMRKMPVLGLAVSMCLLWGGVAQAADATSPPDLKARNPKLKLDWLKPEATLAPFTKVMLPATTFGYRDVRPLSGDEAYSTRTDFPISAKDRELFERNMQEVFRKTLGDQKHYALADATGPGVLVVKTSVLDVVYRIPPERVGRSETYVDTVLDATLVVELADGATGETFARAADRRTAAPATSKGSFGALRSTPPFVINEMRQLAARWGRAMSARLDQLYFAAKPK
jgi:hypothetical protein